MADVYCLVNRATGADGHARDGGQNLTKIAERIRVSFAGVTVAT